MGSLTVPNKYVQRVITYDDETMQGRILYAVPPRIMKSPQIKMACKIKEITCLEIAFPNGNFHKIPISRVKSMHKLNKKKQVRFLWLFVPKNK